MSTELLLLSRVAIVAGCGISLIWRWRDLPLPNRLTLIALALIFGVQLIPTDPRSPWLLAGLAAGLVLAVVATVAAFRSAAQRLGARPAIWKGLLIGGVTAAVAIGGYFVCAAVECGRVCI